MATPERLLDRAPLIASLLPPAQAPAPKPVGRPRCLETQRAILMAAADLLETERYRDITIERIAAVAGVGKQTIYRWYDTKADLMLEAYVTRVSEAVRPAETGDPLADLRAYVRSLVAFLPSPTVRGAYRALIAEAQFDDGFRARFRVVVLERRRAGALALIGAAMAAGQLRADSNADILLDLIFAPLFWRFATSTELPDLAYADAVFEAVLASAAPV